MKAAMTEQDKKTDPTDTDADTEVAAKPATKSARAARRAAAAGATDSAAATGEEGSAATESTDSAGADKSSEGAATGSTPRTPSTGRTLSVTITGRGIAKLVGVLVVIAAIVGVCLLGWGYHQQRARLAAYDASKAASSDFAVKLITSMNSANVGDLKEVLGPLTTGDFHKHLAEEQTDNTAAIQKLQVKATPTVKSVGVERFDANSARTNVLVSVTGTSSLSPQGGQQMTMIWLDLQKQDGKWLVSKVEPAQADVAPAQGTTNAPAGQSPAPASTAPAAPPGG